MGGHGFPGFQGVSGTPIVLKAAGSQAMLGFQSHCGMPGGMG